MFKFIKSIFGESKPSNSNRNLVNTSTNKSKYGDDFSYIYNYDERIAGFIEYNNIPKYAVDWLAESIKNGTTVQISAIYDSVEKGVPYLCETEEEIWLFEKEENPLRNSPEGIHSALMMYKYGSYKNTNKFNYWINRLISLASGGDRMAQGLLCWRGGFVRQDGEYDGCLPQPLWEELKSYYEDNLLKDCDNGDPYCQLAVANNYKKIDDNKKEELYKSAINKGLTDACYYYAKFLNQKRFIENGMTVNIPPYGTDEWQEYMSVELGLYKKGAEFNNGLMAGYCQYRLADMYDCGDGGVFKDKSMAQIWYKKALENGYESAKYRIET